MALLSGLDTKAIVLVVAMLGVIVMTSVAIACGHDGQTYMGGIAALVTIAGYLFSRKPEIEEEDSPAEPY